ncbi:MAG: glycoside hydrolase family 43 protein, partial [Bacilli bacterium]|nr:glycoside hydrolase family 43 protein [Bacilli bacterium]
IYNLKRRGKLIYKTEGKVNAWAPEIHFFSGKWYIYFAVPKSNEIDRRMFVLEGDKALGPYNFVGQITDKTDKWAIDGTILEWNDNLYFIWSGWEADINEKQNIYIAHMSNPVMIDSERVMISTPKYELEKVGFPMVNEGPEVLVKNNKLYIIYSASGSWTKDYCLGMLTFDGGDIMDKNSWKKRSTPVFKTNNNILGPGHACFVRDEYGNDLIIYPFLDDNSIDWEKRVVRMKN